MNGKALILLLHFSVYIFSGFALTNHNETKPGKNMCCSQMAAKHQHPKKCPGPSQNKTTNCYDCPLIYIATLTPAVTISLQSITIKKEFGLKQDDKLNKFHSAVWKPPNVS